MSCWIVGRLLLNYTFLMLLKSCIFFSSNISDGFTYICISQKKKLIYAFSLHHSKCIKNEPFVKSTRNKFQPYITLFTKYLALYNN